MNICSSSSRLLNEYEYNYNFDEPRRYGVTKYVSHTNGSFQLQIVEEEDVGSSGSSGSSGSLGATGGIGKRAVISKRTGVGFFHVIGPGDLAFYRLIKDCTTQWNSVASFNCGGRFNDYRDY